MEAFRTWLQRNKITDLDAPGSFYDYRGAFLAGINRGSNGHWPDTFKQHGHPTFSVESKYAAPNDSTAGRWQGNQYISPQRGPALTPPLSPVPLPRRKLADADLWEYYRARGLSPEGATLHVERRRSAQPKVIPPSPPTKTSAALTGAIQGETMGFGDELLGLLHALGPQTSRPPGSAAFLLGQAGGAQEPPITRESINQNINAVRDQFANARFEHPWVAGAANIAGSMVNPAARLLPAPINAVKGAITGAALGAAQGLGEGEGSVTERLPSAAIGAVAGTATGAVLGGTLGKLVNKYAPHAKNAWNAVIRLFGGKAAATPQAHAAAEQAAETAVRDALQKAGKPPEVIEQVVATMRQQGKIPTAQPPQAPMAVRPGETITPIAPKGFEVTGPAPALKQGPFPPTLAEMQGFSSTPRPPLPDVGRGQTLPYYPRGGKVEQAFGPYPVSSAPAGPSPQALAQLKLLLQMTDQELASVEGIFPKEVIQQVRAFRAQGLGR
jgi:hypothetical protein